MSCATSAPKPSSLLLSDILQAPDIIKLPYEVTESGLFIVEAGLGDNIKGKMILDTGATRSAIYEHIYTSSGIGLTGKFINIHGMVHSGLRPELLLPFMELGGHRLDDISVAVLEDPAEDQLPANRYNGLIGLDVLSHYYAYFDNPASTLFLIPRSYSNIDLPRHWQDVSLRTNPFGLNWQDLKFLDVRVTGKVVPALFDLGSEISAISWSAINHPQVKIQERRLKKNWELRGAIGTFDPKLKVRLKKFRSGQKFWEVHDFIILNFESLEILGIEKEPFMIAGAGMFSQTSFWLDLQDNKILFKPEWDQSTP